MSKQRPREAASASAQPPVSESPRRAVLAGGLVLAGLALLALAAPSTSALHLSVGASEAIGVAPEENPGDPSVGPAWYEVGTRDPEGCYEPDPNAPNRTQTEIEAALSKEGFCGKLVYEPGTLFQRPSPEDQHLPGSGVGVFDAMVVTYVGNHQFQTCIPWCYPPGGQHGYEGLHTVGAELGHTDGGDRAFQRDGGWQEYAVNLALPNPASLVDDAVGTHPMNGWIFPVWDQTMVAFLEDADGDPIDDRTLEARVAEQVTRGELPPASVPRVCGFTPDADVRPLNAPASFCEVEFRWIDQDQTAERDRSASGPCRSATYLCAAVQPHWQAEVTCAFVLANCGSPATEADDLDAFVWENEDGDDDVQRDGEEPPERDRTRNSDPPASADSTVGYVRWHFVVAPTPSACNGVVDPGFAIDPARTGTPQVYLAHDLDVYTPLAHLATGPPQTSGFTNLRDWGQAHVHGLTGQGRERWPDPGRSGGTTELPVEETRRHVAKDRLTEPNARDDTSQSHVRIDRGNVCTRVAGTPETEATQDPWVDIVDARVVKTGQGTGAYGNDRADQDAGNRPGPGWFTTRGMVGVFTDPDDDGAYEQAPASGVFSEIFDAGAYPMFWDMHLSVDGTPAPERACELDDRSLTAMMSEAGYGERTGLIQLVLLHEGADWFYREDPTWLEHEDIIGLDGDASSTAPNAYLFMSQGLWRLHELGGLDGIVDDLRDRLPADHHLVPSTAMLAPPEGGRSDFYGQCGEGSGGFTSRWDFTHHCLEAEFAACSGDTVLTAYVYENDDPGDVLGEAGGIPAFRPTGWRAFDGLEGGVWVDVDPLDNDPERNTAGGAPPTGDR